MPGPTVCALPRLGAYQMHAKMRPCDFDIPSTRELIAPCSSLIMTHVDHRPPRDNPATLNTQLYIQLFERKLARFQQFAALYPECYWTFVGDNGQVPECFALLLYF